MKNKMFLWLLVLCLISSQAAMTVPASEKAEGTMMRLASTEGTVAVESQNGKKQTIRQDMKLYSGNQVSTEQASYAYVSLDEAKAVKLDALSKGEVRKSGKQLEFLLKSGNLFFDVKEPLKADETLNIRTSTMVTGIRGTTGIVSALDSGVTCVALLDGSLMILARDPVTRETRSVQLQTGQKALIKAGKDDRGNEFVEIYVAVLTKDDISGFAGVELSKDETLRLRLEAALGDGILPSREEADERLRRDQSETKDSVGGVMTEVESGLNTQAIDPVFSGHGGNTVSSGGGGSGGGGSSGGNSGGSGGGNITSGVIDESQIGGDDFPARLTEAFTAHDKVTLGTGNPDEGEQVSITGELAVPEGKTLSVNTNVNFNEGSSVNVNGTLEVEENTALENNGTITNNGVNTLHVRKGGALENSGVIVNNGRTLIEGRFYTRPKEDGGIVSFRNNGTLVNNGDFEAFYINVYGLSGPAEAGELINASGGVLENHGLMMVSMSNNFLQESGSRWSGSDGIYMMNSNGGSVQDAKDFCGDVLGEKTICVEGNQTYVVGTDFLKLMERLNMSVTLAEDIVLENQDLIIKEDDWGFLSLNGNEMKLQNSSIIVKGALNIDVGNDVGYGKNRIIGEGTDCLIENSSNGNLKIEGVGVCLDSPEDIDSTSYAILNHGNFIFPSSGLSVENKAAEGWAFANEGGVIENGYSSDGTIELQSSTWGYTMNVASGDMWCADDGMELCSPEAENPGGQRHLTAPARSKLTPTGSLAQPAPFPKEKEVLDLPAEDIIATSSNARLPKPEETETPIKTATPDNALINGETGKEEEETEELEGSVETVPSTEGAEETKEQDRTGETVPGTEGEEETKGLDGTGETVPGTEDEEETEELDRSGETVSGPDSEDAPRIILPVIPDSGRRKQDE